MMVQRIARKTRLYFTRVDITERVVSIGGVGTTSLVAHLENGDRDRIYHHRRRAHCIHPDRLPEARRDIPLRSCFIYGDPYASVLSVFRRGLQRRHEISMSFGKPRRRRVLRSSTPIQTYLDAGVDRFHLAEHISNWTGYRGHKVQVMAVQYESLPRTMPEVLSFLGCDRPFQVRPRTSRVEDQPPRVQEGLERMYGDLRATVKSLPEIIWAGG